MTFFTALRYYDDNETAVINAQTPLGLIIQNFPATGRNFYGYGRMDAGLSPKNKLGVAYKYKDKSKTNRNVGGFDLPARALNLFDRENEVRVFDNAILSDRLLNNVRLSLKDEPTGTSSLTNQPALLVPGAFNGGGGQISQQLRERDINAQDILDYFRVAQDFRFGGGAIVRSFNASNSSNFGGSFSFSSLAAFSAGTPFLFTMNTGNPNTRFSQNEYFAFASDETQLGPRGSVSMGLRYEGQSNVGEQDNFGPRLGFAFNPHGGRTVIRLGGGIFYDRQPPVMQQDGRLYGGQQIRQAVIANPGYPVAISNPGQLQFSIPSILRVAPNIGVPTTIQGNISVERRFGSGQNFLTLDFTTLRGTNLYLNHNLNAPLPSSGFLIRPNPNFININQFESSGSSLGNFLTASYRTTIRRRLNLFTQYTLSKSQDNTSGFLYIPSNNYNIQADWGRSNFDQLHRFKVLGTYELPYGFDAGLIFNAHSGFPYNITTGFDNNHDTVANDRPPGVGRNTGNGPGAMDMDVHLARNFRLRRENSKPKLQIGIDAFNVFNTVNYKNFVGVLTSPYFGFADAALPACEVQLSVRIKF